MSAWTQALAAPTLSLLGAALRCSDVSFSEKLYTISKKIEEAFHSYLIKNGVIADPFVGDTSVYAGQKELGTDAFNPYRKGGIIVPKDTLLNA